jgi:maltooligosyltrehalose trehalohydrolase
MGEEYAEPAPFPYFVSHGDPALVNSVRNGRRTQLAKFQWTGDMPDPQDEGTFLRSILNWKLRTKGHHRLLWNFYQELLRLRRDLPALAQLDKEALDAVAFADSNTIVVRRWSGLSHILALFHFDPRPTQLALQFPVGRWQKKLDSAEPRWSGGGSQASDILASHGEAKVALSPWGVVLYAETLSGPR